MAREPGGGSSPPATQGTLGTQGTQPAEFSSTGLRSICRRLPPPGRQSVVIEVDDPKHAALLVPLIETNEGLGLVVTRRTASLRHHGDDWVFPGGGLDPADPSAAAAAAREASEELGIAEEEIEILGQLDRRGPILTGYVIDVFVALLAPTKPWRPDAAEVAEVTTVPLDQLVEPEATFRAPIDPSHDPGPIAAGRRVAHPGHKPLLHFVVRPGQHLWGLQADILAELIGHLDPMAAERLERP